MYKIYLYYSYCINFNIRIFLILSSHKAPYNLILSYSIYTQPGHVFTIEPMLNLGQAKDVLWPDQWTAVRVLYYTLYTLYIHVSTYDTNNLLVYASACIPITYSYLYVYSYTYYVPIQVTRDGSRSSQFEHTMIVTETGVELLTPREGEPTDRLVWNQASFQR